jgi:hypothetical protein
MSFPQNSTSTSSRRPIDTAVMPLTKKHGGLLFSKAEIKAFNEIARECGEKPWDLASFKTVVV